MVTICISVFNRLQYTMKSIASLHKVIQNKIPVVFMDDHSDTINTAAIREYITEQGMTNYKYYYNERNLGIERGVFFLPYMVDTTYMYISDNDVIYGSRFYETLQTTIKTMQELSNNTIVSLFDAPEHKIINSYNDDYNIKATLGGVSMLVKKDYFVKALSYVVMNDFCNSAKTSWDWGATEYVKQNNGLMLSTKNSYVQHIGEEGLHSRKNIPNSFVKSNNFIE